MPKYGVVKAKDRTEWLIRRPGGRLDHWGPPGERAEYDTLDSARAQRRLERAETFADVVEIPDDVKDLDTFTVVDAHDPNYRYDQGWRPAATPAARPVTNPAHKKN